jgi:WXG100 family type VII secretion target
MANFIRIDYLATLAKAAQIKKLALEMRVLSREVEGVGEDAGACWQGEASTSYQRKVEELKAKIELTSRQMDSLADAIIRIAKIIKETDERIANSSK